MGMRRIGPLERLTDMDQQLSLRSSEDQPHPTAQTVVSVVGIGASAGGLVAVETLLGGLPPRLPVPVFVVLHIGPNASEFPALLSKHTPLVCRYAEDREQIRAGAVYVAPPDCHMIVENQYIRLTRGPRENW